MRFTQVHVRIPRRPTIQPGSPCPELPLKRKEPATPGVQRVRHIGDRQLMQVAVPTRRKGIVAGKGTSNCGEIRPADYVRFIEQLFDGNNIPFAAGWLPLTYPYPPGIYVPLEVDYVLEAVRWEEGSDGSLPNTWRGGTDQSTPRFLRTIATWNVPDGMSHARVHGPVYARSGLAFTETQAVSIPISAGPTTYEPAWRLALTDFPEFNDPWQPIPSSGPSMGTIWPGWDADPRWDPSGADIAAGSTVVSVFDPDVLVFGSGYRQIDTVDVTLSVTPGGRLQLELINETAVGSWAEVDQIHDGFLTVFQFAWPTDGAAPAVEQDIVMPIEALVEFRP